MEVWIRQSPRYACEGYGPMPFPVPGWMWDRALGQQLYDERIRFIRRLDELGFDGLIFTEHHYGPNGGLCPSPNVLLAAATQVTQRIKLVTMGLVLALHGHPVRVAEELAMLDNLSHGRLVPGFISGSARELYAYSMPGQESRARHREAFDLMVKAWTEENPFEWRGQYFNYECVSILPRPLQVPHPPCWTATGSAEALEWAAERHVGLLASGSVQGASETLDYYQTYAETQCSWAPTHLDRGLAREFFMAPTTAEVEERLERLVQEQRVADYGESFAAPRLEELEREKYTPRSHAFHSPEARGRVRGRGAAAVRSGSFLAGDPDAITEQILEQRQACNANVLVIRPQEGGGSLDPVTDMLELFAREVLPVVRKA